MGIKQWPSDERPRERLRRSGAASLSDAELLAIFLGSGGRGEDAVACARRLLSEGDGLAGLLRSVSQPTRHWPKGLGTVAACRLLAAQELGSRLLLQDCRRGDTLSDPRSAGMLFRQKLRDLPHEVFAAAFLDTRHRLIAFEPLFRGGIDGAEVHPREVVRRALDLNAAALLVGHNHPSGVAEPSQADRLLTQRLREALQLVDIRLLDHLVVGDGMPVSMAERGWI